jgi:hypothetical protein
MAVSHVPQLTQRKAATPDPMLTYVASREARYGMGTHPKAA